MGDREPGGLENHPRAVVRRRAPGDTDASALFDDDELTTPGHPLAAEIACPRGIHRSITPDPDAGAATGHKILAWAVALLRELEADGLVELMPTASRSRLSRDLTGLLPDLHLFEAPAAALALWLSTNTSVASVCWDDDLIFAALCASASAAR